MKKIMNTAENFVDESLEGIIAAYPELLRFAKDDPRAVVRANAKEKDKVVIVTGGGYGHLPTFLGYVGKGFCDGVAVGNVFTSPAGETIASAAMETETGKGVLLLFANYVGDCLNFDMAKDILEMQDIEVAYVKASDDAASASRENRMNRRGIAGIYFAYKTAGAAAELGQSLAEVAAVAEKACERISTIGFAFSPCRIPGRTAPVFHLEDDEMELGMGIHGEPGIKRTKIRTSKELAHDIADRLIADQNLSGGEEVAVLINSLGGTSKEELFILFKDVKTILDEKNIRIYKTVIGEYATSMEMIGASVSFFVLDDELKRLLDEPARTPFITA